MPLRAAVLTTLTIAAAQLVLAPSAWTLAHESLLESDARLGSGVRELETAKAAELIRAAVQFVRVQGYRCDSVSYIGLRSVFWSGIALSCNRLRYSYHLKDVGGRWVVVPQ